MKINKKLLFTLKICATILVLYFLLHKIQFKNLITAFQNINIKFFWLSLLFLPVNFFWQIVRWRYLAQKIFPKVNWGDATFSLLGGYSAMLITPGRSGEFIRTLYFPNGKRIALAGLILIEKLFSFFVILFFAGFGFCFEKRFPYFLIFPAITALIFAVICFPRIFEFITQKISKFTKRDLVISFTRKELFAIVFFSAAFFVTYAFQYFLFITAFEPVRVLVWLRAFPLTMFVNSFSFTVGGLGIREGAAVYFFDKYGSVAGESAMNASLLLYTFNVLLPGIIGSLSLVKIRVKKTVPNTPDKS